MAGNQYSQILHTDMAKIVGTPEICPENQVFLEEKFALKRVRITSN